MNTKPEGTNTVTDRILKDYETCKLFNTLFCYPLFSKFTKSKNKQTNNKLSLVYLDGRIKVGVGGRIDLYSLIITLIIIFCSGAVSYHSSFS